MASWLPMDLAVARVGPVRLSRAVPQRDEPIGAARQAGTTKLTIPRHARVMILWHPVFHPRTEGPLDPARETPRQGYVWSRTGSDARKHPAHRHPNAVGAAAYLVQTPRELTSTRMPGPMVLLTAAAFI